VVFIVSVRAGFTSCECASRLAPSRARSHLIICLPAWECP
jgi:hypothetical protein